MSRRSQMEIQIDILRAVANGNVKPTHIMYRANLSWTRLQKLLDTLVSKNLLMEKASNEKTKYKITQKGRKLLEYYRQIVDELTQKTNSIPIYIKT